MPPLFRRYDRHAVIFHFSLLLLMPPLADMRRRLRHDACHYFRYVY